MLQLFRLLSQFLHPRPRKKVLQRPIKTLALQTQLQLTMPMLMQMLMQMLRHLLRRRLACCCRRPRFSLQRI